jgi:mevalonate kinase
MGTGTGFGKTILIGDQFVLRGVPAIVASLPFATECTVERMAAGEGWVLEDKRIEVPGYKEKKLAQQKASIDRVLEVMKIDATETPIKITFGGSLLAGSGVGASAASCVSLARALDATFELGLPDEEINRIGREGEFPYHGIPSGIDNTASTYGGLLQFWVEDSAARFEQIAVAEPLHLVLANSGVTADTSALDGFVLGIRDRDPEAFEDTMATITRQSRTMRAALERSDFDTVGRLMTANHEILIDMELSHPVLVELCERALTRGALGAKLTGGGRGGYMVAMVPDVGTQASMAAAFEDEGYRTIVAEVGRGSA